LKKTDCPATPNIALNEAIHDPMSAADVSAVIGMAWQDDTPFEAMAQQFGLSEAQVIALMREHLKARSFKVWRMRVRGRASKHEALQKAQGRAGFDSATGSAALMGTSPHDTLSESEPLALPMSGVTASSLR
jgi:uncharacterized protein (TIGR03643 family)